MLVFLPGKGEIDACREACEQAVPRDVNVLPFHAGLHAQSIDRVFANRLNRRVFLAAKVTETSLTLSGVRTVIDSGLAHQIEHRGSQNALALMAASQASLDQRAGRAGRTAPDVCVRLFSSSFNPPPSDRPEIERLADTCWNVFPSRPLFFDSVPRDGRDARRTVSPTPMVRSNCPSILGTTGRSGRFPMRGSSSVHSGHQDVIAALWDTGASFSRAIRAG